MRLYINNAMPKKSVLRVDKKKTKELSPREKLIIQLGLENFKSDLEKAGTAHLPEKAERFSYRTPGEYGVIHIPLNRLKQVYQSDKAINPKKVKENMEKMKAGTPLNPVIIGYDYDVHDGHHRWEAAKKLGHTHVPCVVRGKNPNKVKDAKKRYREMWKSEELSHYIDLVESEVNLLLKALGSKEELMDWASEEGIEWEQGENPNTNWNNFLKSLIDIIQQDM
mgnify:CR=1 FL=1